MSQCPCCSTAMLRHVRNQKVYWFCPECWQEMPDLSLLVQHQNLLSLVKGTPQLVELAHL